MATIYEGFLGRGAQIVEGRHGNPANRHASQFGEYVMQDELTDLALWQHIDPGPDEMDPTKPGRGFVPVATIPRDEVLKYGLGPSDLVRAPQVRRQRATVTLFAETGEQELPLVRLKGWGVPTREVLVNGLPLEVAKNRPIWRWQKELAYVSPTRELFAPVRPLYVIVCLLGERRKDRANAMREFHQILRHAGEYAHRDRGWADYGPRQLNMLLPLGRGNASLIVSGSGAGKTTLIKQIFRAAVLRNQIAGFEAWNADSDYYSLLQLMVAELAFERAERLAAQASILDEPYDVLILWDSAKRAAEAYNLHLDLGEGKKQKGGADPYTFVLIRHAVQSAAAVMINGREIGLTTCASMLIEEAEMDANLKAWVDGTTDHGIILEENRPQGLVRESFPLVKLTPRTKVRDVEAMVGRLRATGAYHAIHGSGGLVQTDYRGQSTVNQRAYQLVQMWLELYPNDETLAIARLPEYELMEMQDEIPPEVLREARYYKRLEDEFGRLRSHILYMRGKPRSEGGGLFDRKRARDYLRKLDDEEFEIVWKLLLMEELVTSNEDVEEAVPGQVEEVLASVEEVEVEIEVEPEQPVRPKVDPLLMRARSAVKRGRVATLEELANFLGVNVSGAKRYWDLVQAELKPEAEAEAEVPEDTAVPQVDSQVRRQIMKVKALVTGGFPLKRLGHQIWQPADIRALLGEAVDGLLDEVWAEVLAQQIVDPDAAILAFLVAHREELDEVRRNLSIAEYGGEQAASGQLVGMVQAIVPFLQEAGLRLTARQARKLVKPLLAAGETEE